MIGVELTLKWNRVSGVYRVDSTGQVIPLVVGIGSATSVAWKIYQRVKVHIMDSESRELASFV